jgi:hypothetical protein
MSFEWVHVSALLVPFHIDPHVTCKIGVFHTVLDFALHLDCSHIHPKHRATWCSPQLPICDYDLKRCANAGPQRCRARFEHGDLRAIRKSGQQRLGQVLLDGCYHPACTPNLHTLRRYQVDLQSVCIYSLPAGLSEGHRRQWPWVQSGFLTLHTFVRDSRFLLLALAHFPVRS